MKTDDSVLHARIPKVSRQPRFKVFQNCEQIECQLGGAGSRLDHKLQLQRLRRLLQKQKSKVVIKSAASADSSKTDIQGTKIQGSAGRFSHCTECTTDGQALARISEAALAADLS